MNVQSAGHCLIACIVTAYLLRREVDARGMDCRCDDAAVLRRIRVRCPLCTAIDVCNLVMAENAVHFREQTSVVGCDERDTGCSLCKPPNCTCGLPSASDPGAQPPPPDQIQSVLKLEPNRMSPISASGGLLLTLLVWLGMAACCVLILKRFDRFFFICCKRSRAPARLPERASPGGCIIMLYRVWVVWCLTY